MKNKILLFVLLTLIFVIQIINIAMGVEYVWRIIVFEIGLILLVSIILAIHTFRKYKKIVIDFNNGKYDSVIKTRILLFTNRQEEMHRLYYMKAMSYLEYGDIKMFIRYVDKIEHRKLLMVKCYLKIIYSILINDETLKKEWAKKYGDCDHEDKEHYDKILYLIEQKEPRTGEEMLFIESIKFEKIKQLLKGECFGSGKSLL